MTDLSRTFEEFLCKGTCDFMSQTYKCPKYAEDDHERHLPKERGPLQLQGLTYQKRREDKIPDRPPGWVSLDPEV